MTLGLAPHAMDMRNLLLPLTSVGLFLQVDQHTRYAKRGVEPERCEVALPAADDFDQLVDLKCESVERRVMVGKRRQ